MNKQKTTTKTILIVEDSPTQSMHLKALLEQNGFRCLIATNGQTGLYLAQSALPDVIILDLEMPYLNGFEVGEKLQEDPRTASIPIILMTHLQEEEYISRAESIHALKYIPKDAFAEAVLLETLNQMMQ